MSRFTPELFLAMIRGDQAEAPRMSMSYVQGWAAGYLRQYAPELAAEVLRAYYGDRAEFDQGYIDGRDCREAFDDHLSRKESA
jgi:hypothetical protein